MPGLSLTGAAAVVCLTGVMTLRVRGAICEEAITIAVCCLWICLGWAGWRVWRVSSVGFGCRLEERLDSCGANSVRE